MTAEVRAWDNVASVVRRDGYCLALRWHQHRSTIHIGRVLGNVLRPGALLPGTHIPTVQTLQPRRVTESPRNQYSGEYGLGEFPLHTDLAHWARPPRYFALRCRIGSSAVVTRLLPSSAIESALGKATLRRAVVRSRRPPRGGVQCALPVVFPASDAWGFDGTRYFSCP